MDSNQGSDQWLMERAGKFTGSEFVNVLARNSKTGEPTKAYWDLIWQIATERLNGRPVIGPSGYALKWGKDVEPFMREAYELETGLIVVQSDFVKHPKFPFVGCSPDGMVGPDGGIEGKCPVNQTIHMRRFVEGMPEEFRPQVQGCMWVTGRQWWDFVSYDPHASECYRIFRLRIQRDQSYIDHLQREVMTAELRVQEILTKLSRRAA